MATVPKTGLAAAMRAIMRKKKRVFTPKDIHGLLVLAASDNKIRSTLRDFIRRGEVVRVSPGRYRYDSAHTGGRRSPLTQKIYKAMYVSSRFAVSDIQRLTGQKDRGYIDRIVRRLDKQGRFQKVGRRRCIHGAGAETLWRIKDPQRFRIEVME